MAPSPISYTELQAYFHMHGIKPLSWELDAIRRLDGVALAPPENKPKPERKPKPKK
jgi:hypothetical protein